MHRVGPFADQADPVLETQRTGCRQRGVLAEAVARAETWLEPEALHGIEHHQARHERHQLGVAGVLQFIGIGIEHEPCDVTPGDGRSLVNQFPALVIHPGATHAGPLGPLARKGEGKHWLRVDSSCVSGRGDPDLTNYSVGRPGCDTDAVVQGICNLRRPGRHTCGNGGRPRGWRRQDVLMTGSGSCQPCRDSVNSRYVSLRRVHRHRPAEEKSS
ncbi:unannotated protein [freshwater metagenome]|uniref:Unannotated protein n=1 Tax=freshwater metagenome TaxID=449393 RepID=A0A6J7ENU1_9ZZZZ